MGGTIKRMWKGTPRIRVGLVGLDFAGKSTLCYSWKRLDTSPPSVIVDTNTTELKYHDHTFLLRDWDLGGENRDSLRNYFYPQCDALMFIVDSTDRERIGADESVVDEKYSQMLKREIRGFIEDTKENNLSQLPIVIVCNKIDLKSNSDGRPQPMSVNEIRERLELDQLLAGRRYFIHPASALKSEQIHEGLDWIIRGAFKAENAQEHE